LRAIEVGGIPSGLVTDLPRMSPTTSEFLRELARAFAQESAAETARDRAANGLPVGGPTIESTPAARMSPPTFSAVPLAGPLASLVNTVAQREGVSPALIAAVAEVESGFNSRAVSPAGAKGLMQLMDQTAQRLGVTNPFDPEQNLVGGARYLRGLLDRYHGNLTLALAAYNAGPGAVDAAGSQVPPFPETQSYVRRVLGAFAQYRSQLTE
jgi:soluble lytic murein transglycosylase-like protein